MKVWKMMQSNVNRRGAAVWVLPVILSMAFVAGAACAAEPGHEHEHVSEGPHHGDLVELGKEEYHAEIVHGKDGRISVYLLDRRAVNPVPIGAKSIMLNVLHEGKAEQYKLVAEPEKGDPAGTASCFSLKDKHLSADLDAKGTVARLSIAINGKQYVGKIAHDHDDEHEHDSH